MVRRWGNEPAVGIRGQSRRSAPIAQAAAAAALTLALVAAVDPLSARDQPPAAGKPVRNAAPADPIDLGAWGIEPTVTGADPAPERGSVEIFVAIAPDKPVEALLARAGAARSDAEAAAAALAEALPGGIRPGAELALLFGEQSGGGKWSVERIMLSDDWGTSLRIRKTPDGAFVASVPASADRRPLRRVRGTAGGGLYWSLRAAGVPADAATDYIAAVSSRMDVAEPAQSDRFDLVLADGRLLYAALERGSGRAVRLVKWPTGDRTGWFDADRPQGPQAEMVRPVAGRITSGFGIRIHPILRFARFHRGIDFGAPPGAPIRAAAGGVVVAAGWNGGHGRQVRIAHPNRLVTSYSHMSAIAARAGDRIAQGAVIGYVGSSGFSTGPHLHYEVAAGGRAIDPLSAPHWQFGALGASEMPRLRARLRRLLSVAPDRAAAG